MKLVIILLKNEPTNSLTKNQVLAMDSTDYNFIKKIEYNLDYNPFRCQQNDIIPYGVRVIKTQAYKPCNLLTNISLTNVSIPDSVIAIQNGSFKDSELVNVLYYTESSSAMTRGLPPNLQFIGNNAFNSSNIRSLIIPDSVTALGNSSFQRCQNLTRVGIGNNLTEIPENCFKACSNLTYITIPNNVTKIYRNAFGNIRCSTFITNIALPEYGFNFVNNYYQRSGDDNRIIAIGPDPNNAGSCILMSPL